jgi:ribosomal protein S18 acetylase RimI-like enzyme
MTRILADLSDRRLATAIKANLYAFFRGLGSSSEVEFHEGPMVARWHTKIPHPWFNGVLAHDSPADDRAGTIERVMSYFGARRVRSFTWWLEPGLERDGWAAQLLLHGFHLDDNTPGMALDLTKLPPSVQHPAHLVIRPVEDLAMLHTWAGTFIRGFELPQAFEAPFEGLMASLGLDWPFRHYLGFLNGRPVGASTLFLAEGVAGIYNVATLAEGRGQGIGTALTWLPLLEARDMGYRAGVLQSSASGYGVYLRLGFRPLCTMDHFFFKVPSGGARLAAAQRQVAGRSLQ